MEKVIIGNATLYLGDCLEAMGLLEAGSIDLTVTSPPYDNLRSYNGNNDQWGEHVWKEVIKGLYSVTKIGGVVVWVVGDATIKGSETGTSFKQALWAMECGFKLHDTMIYKKDNYTPLSHRRYEQEWEYMFIFSKGKPQVFNPLTVPCKYAGCEAWGQPSQYKDNSGKLTVLSKKTISATKIKGNIFNYRTGSTEGDAISKKHPARFPEQLASDHIISWSNEGDKILDPFAGSGTTGKMAKLLGRKFVGCEIDNEYFDIAHKRIEQTTTQAQGKLF